MFYHDDSLRMQSNEAQDLDLGIYNDDIMIDYFKELKKMDPLH